MSGGTLSARRLRAIAWKEALHIRRDPRSLAMAFLYPAFLIAFFGYVITFDIRDIRVAVLDQDRTQSSRALVEAFQAAGYFRVTQRLERYADIQALLDRGAVRLALVVPPGFQRDLAAGRPAAVQVVVDGADANTAAIALNYANAIVTAYSARTVLQAGQRGAPIAIQSRVWFNETLKSSNMVVPGLVAVIMMVIAAMLSALTVAREWERGTMEQLIATPVHPAEVIVGKLLPYLAIGLIDVLAAVVVGRLLFQVPFRGNPVLLFALATLFLVGALGLGIFISCVARSQLLATQTSLLATYLPSLLLSGLIFDLASMPMVLRWLSHLVPARYFVLVLRGIFLKGIGLEVLWIQAVAMLGFAAAGLTLAIRAFRKAIA